MNLAIIQARMGSTRLPSKVMMSLQGKPVLEHVVQRVKRSKFVDDIVVATTIDQKDLPIVSFCATNGIRVYVGSEDDVLDRFYQCAKLIRPDNIIRITSDCPLIDPEIIDLIGDQHLSTGADYSSNTIDETFPDGLDAEVMNYRSLEIAWSEALLRSEREHVTPFIKKNPGKFKLLSVKSKEDLSRFRWTIDEPRDFLFLTEIFNRVYPQNPSFVTKDVLDEIAEHPDLLKLNSDILRNEGYLNSLEKDKTYKR